MLLKFLAVGERLFQTFHDILLFFCQHVRIFRIYRREICIQELILFSLQLYCSFLIIDPVQQCTVIEVERLLSLNDLSLNFKLYNGYCFVDPEIHLHLISIRPVRHFQSETGTRVVFIYFEGKCCQREQVDPVPVFQDIQIAIPLHRS